MVLHKTTACFTQNDVLFFIKRHVTFFKWRVVLDEGAEITISLSENVHWRWTLYNCENTYNHFPSRARVYARFQEFLSFCCHKCHRPHHKPLRNKRLNTYLRYISTNLEIYSVESRWKNKEKRAYCPFVFPFFSVLLLSFWTRVWHLWQQKINIAVGMRATRVREKVQLSPPPLLSDTDIAQRNSASLSSSFENYK